MATFPRQAIVHGLWALVLACAGTAQGGETFGPAINPDGPAINPDCNCCCTPAGAEFCACKPDICCPPPRPSWYVRAEAVILRRDPRGSVNVAALEPTQNNVLLSTRELDEPFKAGPRLVIGHSFVEVPYQIELSYFQMTDWDAETDRRDLTGRMLSPFSNFGAVVVPAGFDGNTYVHIRERSGLRDGELNVRRQLPMPPGCFSAAFLFGIRYMGIDEDFTYDSVSIITPQSLTTTSRTRNQLWGPQVGGLFQVYQHPNWWVNFEVKGAICDNNAYQESTGTLTVGGVATPFNWARSQEGTAFVGDFDLNVICKVTPGLTTKLGYQAIWVGEVALAAENFNPGGAVLLNGPGWIDRQGKVLYHGPYAGVELTW